MLRTAAARVLSVLGGVLCDGGDPVRVSLFLPYNTDPLCKEPSMTEGSDAAPPDTKFTQSHKAWEASPRGLGQLGLISESEGIQSKLFLCVFQIEVALFKFKRLFIPSHICIETSGRTPGWCGSED